MSTKETTAGNEVETTVRPWTLEQVEPDIQEYFLNSKGRAFARIVSLRHDGGTNAAFIVRAVNAHDELVSACKSVSEWASEPGDHGGNPYCKQFVKLAEAALAKAEGREVAV